MAAYAVERLAEALGGLSGKKVLILGLSYRADIKEAAYSSALLLAPELKARGAAVRVHDPYFTPEEIAAYGLEAEPSLPATCDAAILQAPHEAYRYLDFSLPDCAVVLVGAMLSPRIVESRGCATRDRASDSRLRQAEAQKPDPTNGAPRRELAITGGMERRLLSARPRDRCDLDVKPHSGLVQAMPTSDGSALAAEIGRGWSRPCF
jgi:hypothetical protein